MTSDHIVHKTFRVLWTLALICFMIASCVYGIP